VGGFSVRFWWIRIEIEKCSTSNNSNKFFEIKCLKAKINFTFTSPRQDQEKEKARSSNCQIYR
jgi:hypothetical protein